MGIIGIQAFDMIAPAVRLTSAREARYIEAEKDGAEPFDLARIGYLLPLVQ